MLYNHHLASFENTSTPLTPNKGDPIPIKQSLYILPVSLLKECNSSDTCEV